MLEVELWDLDPVVCGIWQYLIRASEAEILSLPDLDGDQSVQDLNVCQEARHLIGFWLNKGTTHPAHVPGAWYRSKIRPLSSWGPQVRQRIASQLGAIRHWKIRQGSYEDIPNPAATWFVDPPYVGKGYRYRCGSQRLNFPKLGEWCKSRSGLVVVCEQEGAEWLPFVELASIKSARANRSMEMVWINGGEE